jgi:predicted TIM-barrel fold metal-dependent hydrolase
VQGKADPERLIQLMSLIDGQDLLMFSSDYPHWDFDNPDFVIKDFPPDWQERILHTNARRFYNLDQRLGERKPRASALAGVSSGDSAGVAGK